MFFEGCDDVCAGMAINRTWWERFKGCTAEFCQWDDYKCVVA